MVATTTKNLCRMLKGIDMEEAIPALLAAHNAYIAAEETVAEHHSEWQPHQLRQQKMREQLPTQPPAAPAGALCCSICLEPYNVTAKVVPRMVHCGHNF
jgi:hypothetical protein